MPLNPNGKIDKPALPFPDTVAAAAAAIPSDPSSIALLSPTEKTIHEIWLRLLPSPPSEIPLDESFFDLGGHSILATRLIFELRSSLVVGAPLGIVFDYPTIRTLASKLDSIRDADLGLGGDVKEVNGAPIKEDTEYSDDAELLYKELKTSYDKPTEASWSGQKRNVFLTGATGFLGAFILRDLLSRSDQVAKVFCHVRASSQAKALERLRDSGEGRGAWDEKWLTEGRLEVLVGDLELPKLGMSEEDWDRVAKDTEVIVHNGAVVSYVCNVVLIDFKLIERSHF